MKLFIITGQTATGKTKLALKLAKENNGELINCDSRQIYTGLDIITGKDLPENSKLQFKIQKKINDFDIGYYYLSSNIYHLTSKIWLYDIINPKQYFSSYDYVSCAIPVIQDILSRGKTPIIVGGTYFYLYHLLYEVETQYIKPNWKLRNELNTKSISKLQSILNTIAPQFINELSRSESHNPQRLIRKIEILTHYKKSNTVSSLNSFKIPTNISLSKKLNKNINVEYKGLCFENNDELARQIKIRVEKRFKEGAISEVKKLIREGYTEHDPGLKTIGYRQLFSYFNKRCTMKETTNEWITKEIQYAKRQYTFMKKDQNIEWIFIS